MFEAVKCVSSPKRLERRSVRLKRRMPFDLISERRTLKSRSPG